MNGGKEKGVKGREGERKVENPVRGGTVGGKGRERKVENPVRGGTVGG